jgi:hypothetical protein
MPARSLPLLLLASCASLCGQDKTTPYTFGTTVVSNSALHGEIYPLKEGTARLPAHFSEKKSLGTVYASRLNIWPQPFDEGFPGLTDRFEWFAIDYTGRFWVDEPGEYRFSLLCDDGGKLEVDGKELVDNDGLHVPTALTGSAVLSRGIHHIRITYFQGPRFMVALVVAVAPPGKPWRIFDTDDFLPPADVSRWNDGTISQLRHSPVGGIPRGR